MNEVFLYDLEVSKVVYMVYFFIIVLGIYFDGEFYIGYYWLIIVVSVFVLFMKIF